MAAKFEPSEYEIFLKQIFDQKKFLIRNVSPEPTITRNGLSNV